MIPKDNKLTLTLFTDAKDITFQMGILAADLQQMTAHWNSNQITRAGLTVYNQQYSIFSSCENEKE